MTEQNKIIEMLLGNVKEAFLIEKNIRALKEYLFENFITYINKQIEHLNITVENSSNMEDHDSKFYVHYIKDNDNINNFYVKFERNDRFILIWEFMHTNLIYGIRKINHQVQKDEELYEKIANLLREIFKGDSPKNYKRDDWWVICAWAHKNGMPKNIDENVWAEIAKPETSEFAKKVISIIKTVYENKELLALLK